MQCSGAGLPQRAHEQHPILLNAVDGFLPIPAIHHMLNRPRILKPRSMWQAIHPPMGRWAAAMSKSKVWPLCLSLKFEFFQQFFDPQTVVGGDAFEDAGEGSGFDRMMIRNYLVAFTILLGCYTDMRAFLAIHCIAQDTERLDELRPADIARDFHRARTSSRTK